MREKGDAPSAPRWDRWAPGFGAPEGQILAATANGVPGAEYRAKRTDPEHGLAAEAATVLVISGTVPEAAEDRCHRPTQADASRCHDPDACDPAPGTVIGIVLACCGHACRIATYLGAIAPGLPGIRT